MNIARRFRIRREIAGHFRRGRRGRAAISFWPVKPDDRRHHAIDSQVMEGVVVRQGPGGTGWKERPRSACGSVTARAAHTRAHCLHAGGRQQLRVVIHSSTTTGEFRSTAGVQQRRLLPLRCGPIRWAKKIVIIIGGEEDSGNRLSFREAVGMSRGRVIRRSRLLYSVRDGVRYVPCPGRVRGQGVNRVGDMVTFTPPTATPWE